jgi:thioredoxin reductase
VSAPDLDVVIVGGGPAGMAAALELRRRGVERLLVLEREPAVGGIPRDCDHLGFGWFDFRRVLSGPAYARLFAEALDRHRVEVRTESAVTRWKEGPALQVTSPGGLFDVSARAILLATGCRERPRAARLVPGTRPAGVLTTGALQRLARGSRVRVGRRAVVVGAEHVSFSAVHTLMGEGTEVAAMVTDLPRHQTWAPLAWLLAERHGVPVLVRSEVTRISGRRRVEAVEVTQRPTGAITSIECDCVVFTGDWIPDHELARMGGLAIDAGTRGPQVDPWYRTSVPGVFAAGNLLHGAETAGVAAREGRASAAGIARFLADGAWREPTEVAVIAESPVRWIVPSLLVPWPAASPTRPFVARVSEFVRGGRMRIRQGERVLFDARVRGLVPNRPIRIADEWVAQAAAGAGPVTVTVVPN